MSATGTTRVKFTVEMEIDNEVWQNNYGLAEPTPENIRADIRSYMRDVIDELVSRHVESTGNEGLVHVSYR